MPLTKSDRSIHSNDVPTMGQMKLRIRAALKKWPKDIEVNAGDFYKNLMWDQMRGAMWAVEDIQNILKGYHAPNKKR